jgi:hypothetical protein
MPYAGFNDTLRHWFRRFFAQIEMVRAESMIAKHEARFSAARRRPASC